jgi:hypothetical protein
LSNGKTAPLRDGDDKLEQIMLKFGKKYFLGEAAYIHLDNRFYFYTPTQFSLSSPSIRKKIKPLELT